MPEFLLSERVSAALGGGAPRMRMHHRELAQVAARTHTPLDALLRGAAVYHAPRPAYRRPPELEASLARIRLAHEQAEYARMSGASARAERVEWAELREMLGAVASVAISMAAVATAAWWSGGSASTTWKALVALGLALLVGAAETAMYARHARMQAHARSLAGRAGGAGGAPRGQN